MFDQSEKCLFENIAKLICLEIVFQFLISLVIIILLNFHFFSTEIFDNFDTFDNYQKSETWFFNPKTGSPF